MFCEKCGSPVSDGVSFCPKCGAKISVTAAAQQAESINNSDNINNFDTTVVNDTAVENNEIAENDTAAVGDEITQSNTTVEGNVIAESGTAVLNGERIQTKKKKPFFKRPLGITLIVLLVVIIGGGITAFALRDNILKAVLGPVKYYGYKEVRCFSSMGSSEFSIEGDITTKGEQSSLSSWAGSSSNKMGIEYNQDTNDKKAKLNLDFMGFINIDFMVQDKLISLSVNDSEPIVGDLSKKKSSSSGKTNGNSDNSKKNTVDLDDISELAGEIAEDCLIPAIDEDKVKEDTDSFNGNKCTVDTFVLDSDFASDFCNNLADKIESDKDTQETLEEFYEAAAVTNPNIGEFDADAIAEELREAAENTNGKGEINYSVYYDGGQIVHREIVAEDEEISLSTYNDDDKKIIAFEILDSCSGEFEITNKADVSDVDIDKKDAKSMDEFYESLGGLLLGDVLGIGGSDDSGSLDGEYDFDDDYNVDDYDFGTDNAEDYYENYDLWDNLDDSEMTNS